jgi:hypothetical protein
MAGPWEPPTFDRWTPLDHKRGLAAGRNTAVALSWVPETERRRLAAYAILNAYLSNSQREMLDFAQPLQGELKDSVALKDAYENHGDAEYRRRQHREYGDPSLLVSQVAAAVLGEEPQIVVPGIEDQEALAERQEWLRTWADDEGLMLALIEAENDAQGLGDGVMAMGWDAQAGRSVVEVYDPGMYFPVLSGRRRLLSYPDAVHFAWEYEEDNKRWVERVTWRLVPKPGMTRRPWQEPGEPAPTHTCIHTDIRWRLDSSRTSVDALEDRKGETLLLDDDGREVRSKDLEIDFLPVIHRPNTVSRKEHFGASLLSNVAQILDDLAFGDTDVRSSATLAAGPVIGLANAAADTQLTVQPGTVFGLGPDGRMDVLDLTQGLERLGNLQDALLKRLSTNSRVPEEILGRVSAAEVPSGITMLLAFAPFRALIGQARLARQRKDRLVLKFNQRLAQIAGELLSGPTVRAEIVPGQFLPSDLDAAITRAARLVDSGAGSRRTAVAHLADAGLDVGAVAEEVERIEHEDFEGAARLLDALGDEAQVADYLGRKAPDNPEAPPVRIEQPS